MTPLTQCLLFAFAIVAARAAVSTIEIYEGAYYGFDDPHEAIAAQAHGSNPHAEVTAEQPTTGRPGSNRRGNNRGRHGQGNNRHHHGNMTNPHQWTDEQKLTHLCAMLRPASGGDASRRYRSPGPMMARKLQMMSAENRQTVTEMWNRRKQDMLRCCGESSSDRKLQCVNEARLSRYDRVCRGAEPLCPWAAFMPSRPGQGAESHAQSTSNTTDLCCARQATERLDCFATARAAYKEQYEQMKARGGHHGHGQGHGQGHGHGHGHGRGSHEERRRHEGEGRRGSGGRRQRPEGGD